MTTNFSTKGGVVTRGETFVKLMDHLREAQDCCAVMGHLHRTEEGARDEILAMGWLAMAELFRRMQHKITALAQGHLQ